MISADIRRADIDRFLADAGWGEAERLPLTADASTRRYIRLRRGGETAMLMDSPGQGEAPACPPDADAVARAALGWNALSRLAASRVDAFVAIARHLDALGLSAPKVLAADPDRGLALLEDFGDAVWARHLTDRPEDERPLYADAGSLLAHLQDADAPDCLPIVETGAAWPILPLDWLALEVNVDLFAEWMPQLLDAGPLPSPDRASFARARDDLVGAVDAHPKRLTLRDYHAENLIWLPDRPGLRRIGLLDFQDAVRGPRTWDLSMLLHDARRDVSPEAHAATLTAYAERTGLTERELTRELAEAGLANTLRILGIFARLIARDGKLRYREFLAREWRHLDRLLETPGLEGYRLLVALVVPDWERHAA